MTLHWDTTHTRELMLVIGAVGFVAVLAGAAVSVTGSRAPGGPVLLASPAKAAEQGQVEAAGVGSLQMTAMISPRGDYRFEAPATWANPLDPRDVTLEGFFVGPVDQTRHTMVMMMVSRYSRRAHPTSMENMLAQLQGDKGKHILGTETIAVDRRPARLVRIHEVTSMLSTGLEVLSLDLRESIVMVENGPDLFVIEYVASPDVYGEYWPIFDRLVTNFQFVPTPR